MKFYLKKIIIVFFLALGAEKIFAQSASTIIQYNGAWALGCCTVCGADYWCLNDNHPGACGQGNPCLAQTFVDPVPAGNLVVSAVINYYTADCYGNALTGTIDGDVAPTVNEQNLGCLCSNNPCGLSASTTDNYPCGLATYVYGGTNTFTLCTGVDVCVDRVELVLNYVPGATPGGPTYTWQGTVSNNWNDPCNWDTKTVPTSAKNVIVPSGYTYAPIVYNGVNASCYTLTVVAPVEVQTGGSLNVTK